MFLRVILGDSLLIKLPILMPPEDIGCGRDTTISSFAHLADANCAD